MIDNSICKTAIQNMKALINECFQVCELKNSTYKPTKKTLANHELFNAIGGIPVGSSGTTTYAQSFSGFDVTASGDSNVTINCGSIGTNWKAITIYSNTKNGWFSIYKINSYICILCANPWYAIVDDPVLEDGQFPYRLDSSSYRCLYNISGNSISLTAESYIGQDSSSDISICCNQISNESYYMLDTIDVIY